ncbi:hypothetical protein GCM10010174_07170 [Kutzneria viridogrisea]|uniref:Transposase n=1 Tax=Kutzneria viridogrisea TaxID=47990 RepID=A0ABR6BUH5_9PSEU|nr:transposase [Kutzneria viridogrisea]
MPKLLRARPPRDAEEERVVRKLAGARHAPGDWMQRARIVVLSWDGVRGPEIAARLGCHPETVRRRLHRFNQDGVDGLSDWPGCGRKRRITEDQRSRIIALVKMFPPGRLLPCTWEEGLVAADEDGPRHWTLNTVTEAARAEGIEVGRSQVRRILLAEGVRWRRTRSWIMSTDPEFVPKGRGSSVSTLIRRRVRR